MFNFPSIILVSMTFVHKTCAIGICDIWLHVLFMCGTEIETILVYLLGLKSEVLHLNLKKTQNWCSPKVGREWPQSGHEIFFN